MASNAASSVQFRVNGTEMARGRTRKTERSQSMTLELSPAPRGASKVNVETTVTNGSLSSVPKTQATSVLPVAREESQRLSAGGFPEADLWPIPNIRFARDSAGTQTGQTRIVSCDRLVSTTIYAIWGLPINELYTSGPCRPLIRYPSEANLSVIFRSKVE
jgi:hypothetical protein